MAAAAETIAYRTADAAFDKSGSVTDLVKLQNAENAYFAALTVARERWLAENLTEEQRACCEENANETEGTEGDDLHWLRMALGTAEDARQIYP